MFLCLVLWALTRILMRRELLQSYATDAFHKSPDGRGALQESAMSVPGKVLDPSKRSPQLQEFESALRAKIVGQDEAVEALVAVYQVFRAGLNAPGRPVGNLLFLGPTGSGKTRIVEAAAETLFGDKRAVVKIDCAEFQHSHEIAKLIGSPPGYLGHRDTHPVITEESLSQYHTESLKLSLLLFDEIEKASDALWQLLLGILDKATLTLGDTRRVDLSQTIIFLTSNLGAREIAALVSKGMGFVEPSAKPAGLDAKLERTAVEAARRRFSPEFINRLDRVVVFHRLQPEQLEGILDIELAAVQKQVIDGPRAFHVSRHAKGESVSFARRHGSEIWRASPRNEQSPGRWFIRWRICWRRAKSNLATCCASIGTAPGKDWSSRTRGRRRQPWSRNSRSRRHSPLPGMEWCVKLLQARAPTKLPNES